MTNMQRQTAFRTPTPQSTRNVWSRCSLSKTPHLKLPQGGEGALSRMGRLTLKLAGATIKLVGMATTRQFARFCGTATTVLRVKRNSVAMV